MDFKDVLNDTYVDKSMLIAYMNGVLNTTSRYMCVTRARRFGKSLAAKMLCAYYDQSCNSRSLFADLQIAQHPSFEAHLNQYPVIYLDATEFTSNLQSDDFSVLCKMNDALSRELPTGKGFADIVFVPRRNVDKPAIVIELKCNHSAESGLEQIKRKQYADSLRDYVGDVVLVGISYDEKTKEHSCVIERMGRENSQSKKKITKYGQKIHKVILLLEALEKPLSASQMREICEKKDVSYFNRMTIQPMVKDGVIEPMDKESIQSPQQKYYRTVKGLELLTKLQSE